MNKYGSPNNEHSLASCHSNLCDFFFHPFNTKEDISKNDGNQMTDGNHFLCLQLMHKIFHNVKYMGSILISLLNIVKPFNCIIVLICAQILTLHYYTACCVLGFSLSIIFPSCARYPNPFLLKCNFYYLNLNVNLPKSEHSTIGSSWNTHLKKDI